MSVVEKMSERKLKDLADENGIMSMEVLFSIDPPDLNFSCFILIVLVRRALSLVSTGYSLQALIKHDSMMFFRK